MSRQGCAPNEKAKNEIYRKASPFVVVAVTEDVMESASRYSSKQGTALSLC
jgi:hypothetical protein